MAMTCTFGKSQKPTPERAEFGTCWKWRRSLARQFAATCFCMPFWVVIRRLALTVLEKPRPSKKYGYSVYFQHQAKVFDIPGSTQAEAATAGENALVVLYGGKQGESLDSLRYRRYYEKVSTSGQQIQPQNLPPVSATARYHSLSTGQTVAVSWWGDAVWRQGLEA